MAVLGNVNPKTIISDVANNTPIYGTEVDG